MTQPWHHVGDARRLGIDPQRIVIAGHSMGGWVTALTAAHHPELLGAILISAADIGSFGRVQRDTLATLMAGDMESLSGVTAMSIAADLNAGATGWTFEVAAPGLARMPMLVLTSNDGLAAHTNPLVARVRALGNTRVTTVHQQTDHSWSDARITLQAAVIGWLAKL